MRVAINHPYFFPYAGYFRLMAHADLFVALDCAQFPRRGFVHRNRFPDYQGNLRWLTLALEKQPRNILIKDIRFINDINVYMGKQLKRFPCLSSETALKNPFVQALKSPEPNPVEYIFSTLCQLNKLFKFDCKLIKESDLNINHSLNGEEKILAILRSVGATEYVNASGGRHLYDNKKFNSSGIKTRFLVPYQGFAVSILFRILNESESIIKHDIISQIRWQT